MEQELGYRRGGGGKVLDVMARHLGGEGVMGQELGCRKGGQDC